MLTTIHQTSTFSFDVRQMIAKEEGFGASIYIDSAGVPTVGYGYALLFYNEGAGMWQAQSAADIQVAFTGTGISLTSGDFVALQQLTDDLNTGATVNDQNAALAGYQTGGDLNFTLTQSQAGQILENTIGEFTALVESRFKTHLGATAGAALFAGLQNTQELVALTSLAYNTPSLIGKKLTSAIQAGNRAEAWFEIRYNSNGNALDGIAKRRFYEAEVFGLYEDESVSALSDAQRLASYQQLFQMFARHYDNITAYEAASSYGAQIGAANGDYGLSGDATVEGYRASFATAQTFLENYYTDWKAELVSMANAMGANAPAVLHSLSNSTFNEVFVAPEQAVDSFDSTLASLHGLDMSNMVESNDLLIGKEFDETLIGGAGDDVLVGGAGADTLDGSAGLDVASYAQSNAGVTVDLTAGTGLGGDAQGDILSGIESVIGSNYNDTITGGAAAGVLSGGNGHDDITAGSAGDVLVGGWGADFLTSDQSGVTMLGGEGHDILNARVGGSTLNGGAGNDILASDNGQANNLTFVFGRGGGTDIVTVEPNFTTSIEWNAWENTLLVQNNTLRLEGLNPDDVEVFISPDGSPDANGVWTPNWDMSNFDTVVRIKDTGEVVVLKYQYMPWEEGASPWMVNLQPVKSVEFADGTVWSDQDLQDNTIFVEDLSSVIPDPSLGDAMSVYTDVFYDSYFGAQRDGNIDPGPTSETNGSENNDFVNGTSGSDVLNGLGGDDVLYAQDGDDLVNGGDGDDVIIGGTGAGDDVYVGDVGVDTVTYQSSTAGVVVDLAAGTATDVTARAFGDPAGEYIDNDTLSSIENVLGSKVDDTISGDGGDNLLMGSGGADTLAGGAGNDTMVGGQDDVLVSPLILQNAVMVGYDANTPDGDDVLIGGTGNDTLIGGDGVDTAVFFGNVSDYEVTFDAATGQHTVLDLNAADGDDGMDILSEVERLQFADGIVDLTVVNAAPMVSGQVVLMSVEDSILLITETDLLANATDTDGDVLSVSGVVLSDPAAGSLVDNLDGTWTFTPIVNWNGALSLDYIVSDGTTSVAASADLTVGAVNDNPVAVADMAATNEDVAVTITAASLLANDTDVDGDTLSLSSVNNPVGGTVALDGNGDVVFTPDANFNGEATFDYSVSDGFGGTSTSTVTVVVSPEPQQNTGMPVAVGSEFQVNTYTAGAQRYGIPISLSDGRYVISWQSMLQDGSSYGVYGQVFDADGTAVGSEFRVNTYTLGAQGYVSLSASQDGGFLATWESYGQDGGGYGIYAQSFDNLGSKVGDEFLVNTTTAGSQNWPDVTTLNNGDYVIAWHSFNQDGDSAGIYAQRFDGTGTKVGAETLINTTTVGFQAGAEVDALADGGYVIVWQSPDANGNGVFGQRFDASGNAVDGEFQVNTSTIGEQRRRDVTGLEGGGFVVVWEDEYIFNQRACARVFDANGNPIGDEFQVNTSGVGVTSIPQVTSISDGGFVVVWKGNDSDASGVFVQRYDALGNRVGDELQVNTYEVGSQGDPFITELASGDLLVSWESLGQDGAQGGIYAQRLSLGNVGHLGTENADQLIGDNDANTLTGSGGDDTLWGLGGRDVLSGGTGNDTLYGGSGDDTYQIARGDGQDLIVNIGEGGSADTISYSTGINHDQLWFTQSGNDLVVGIIGTTDQVTVSSWYANPSNQVASIETADGQYVTNAMVNNLVSAMAAMTPPPVGQTNLTAAEHTQLDSVIAANWQPQV